MAATAAASSQPPADKAGGVIPELDELKLCIRTIKDENPEQGIAKVNIDVLRTLTCTRELLSGHIQFFLIWPGFE